MPLCWQPLKTRKTGRDPFHTVLPAVFRDLRGRRQRGISKRVSHSMGWAFLTSFRRFNGGNCSHKSCRTTTPKIKLLLPELLWNSSVTLVTNHLATAVDSFASNWFHTFLLHLHSIRRNRLVRICVRLMQCC